MVEEALAAVEEGEAAALARFAIVIELKENFKLTASS